MLWTPSFLQISLCHVPPKELISIFRWVSLESACACNWHSVGTGRGLYSEAKQTCITRLEHHLLFLATICPFAIAPSPPTLFLVDNVEKVWSEHVRSISTPSSLLVNTSGVSPLSFHLHVICGAFFAPGHRLAFVLLLPWDQEGSSGVGGGDLGGVVHADFVDTIITFVEPIHLAENESAKRRITHSITGLMPSQRLLKCAINRHLSRKRQSELAQVGRPLRVILDRLWYFLLSLVHTLYRPRW